MANEYLQRTPTSTGNRRVWTWSAWIKRANQYTSNAGPILFGAGTSGSNFVDIRLLSDTSNCLEYINYPGSVTHQIRSTPVYRDSGSWMHILISIDTTNYTSIERLKMFINGSRITDFRATGYPSINDISGLINATNLHYIGRSLESSYRYFDGELTDVFFIDGQALTPDVFGFNKPGKGYISVGSTQATDFRPGQWVPKTPRIIKTEIIRRGGFGVNGFYLPMNDSNNFGADFHCTPNSIIKLQENLPQPRCRIDGVGDYTGALRADPFKQYLVLALPFVSGGLQSGFGDYSAAIKGSGSPISLTNAGVSIASTAGYYGSAAFFNNANASGTIKLTGDNVAVSFGTGDWTVESWIFPTQLYDYLAVITTRAGNGAFSDAWHIGIYADGRIVVYSDGQDVITSSGAIKVNQWTHIAVVRKNNNLTFYVNGVAAGVNTNYTKNLTRTLFGIGQFPSSNQEAFSGYIQDLRIYKGVAKYTGGFDVPKPYTPVGIATWRAVPDTTANNFATLNGTSIPSKYTVSNGNLTFTNSTTNWTGWLEGTVGFSTGKYYWETRIDVSTDYHHIGIVGVGITHFNTTDAYRYGVSYQPDGRYWAENNNLTAFQTGITQSKTVGDIVMLAVDMSSKKMWIGKNGTWFSGDPSNGSSPPFDSTVGFNYTHYVPFYDSYGSSGLSINFGQNPTFSGNTTAGTFTDSNGKGLFKYQPPSGFLSLCEDNLPTPAIANPGRHFKTVLWTGDGNSGRSIVGVGFTPDLVWIKSRGPSAYNHRAFDSVRGAGKDNFLMPNSTAVEGASSDYYGGISSFNADGFSMVYGTGGSNIGINESGTNFVAWCWRAGAGTTSTNTNGSITSVVSVNQDAGFSIVSYTGTAASATVGHGLGKAPGLIILKNRDDGTRNWPVYHKSFSIADFIYLNLTNAKSTDNSTWGTTNSSIFTLGNGVTPNTSWNANGQRFIAYCWAEIEGYSKFGSFSGNSSTDGVFVYTGFRPAWVMIKRTDSTDSWAIFDSSRDSTNPVERLLRAESSNAEATMTSLVSNPFGDLLSNGFKVRNTSTIDNASGGTYIFAAFAESPFSYSNSK